MTIGATVPAADAVLNAGRWTLRERGACPASSGRSPCSTSSARFSAWLTAAIFTLSRLGALVHLGTRARALRA